MGEDGGCEERSGCRRPFLLNGIYAPDRRGRKYSSECRVSRTLKLIRDAMGQLPKIKLNGNPMCSQEDK